MPSRPVAPFGGSREIEIELKHNSARAQRVLKSFGLLSSGIQLSLRQEHSWGYRLEGKSVAATSASLQQKSNIRIYRSGRVVEHSIDSALESDLAVAIETAAKEMESRQEPFPVMPEHANVRRVVSFDPRLAEYACSENSFRELASALSANTWHEAARIPGLETLDGSLMYRLTQTFVVRRESILSHTSGGLRCRIQFNQRCGEEVFQVNAPQSFLPTALIGARTWRNSPVDVTDKDWAASSEPTPVVFHPRVLETLIRSGGQAMLEPGRSPLKIGMEVGDASVNLIDDPGLDGLLTSRGFDDLGQRSHRLALVLKGKLVRHLSRVNVGGGHHWRREDGSLGLGFSSIVMNRGEMGFHRLLAERPWQILINRIGAVCPEHLKAGRFWAPIVWGVLIDGQGRNRALPSGEFAVSGQIFGMDGLPGILSHARLSHELHDTGSAILPYLFSTVDILSSRRSSSV